jgi:hypothetical protein
MTSKTHATVKRTSELHIQNAGVIDPLTGLYHTSAITRLCTGPTKSTKKAPNKIKINLHKFSKNVFKKYFQKYFQEIFSKNIFKKQSTKQIPSFFKKMGPSP